jgi:hypothetical protein
LAGVGEELRRVPWKIARVEQDRLLIDVDDREFECLEQLDREDWPGR